LVRAVAIAASAVLVMPLALQRDISSLRYVSPVSICALLYMAVVVTAKAPGFFREHEGGSEYGPVELFNLDVNFCEAFSLCVFAFNCHLNVIPVASTMVSPSRARIEKVSFRVNVLQLLFYTLIGVAGYLSFLGDTQSDILLDYSADDLAVAGGRIALTGTMLVAIPLNLHPTIKSALQIGDYCRGEAAPETRAVAPRSILTVVCILCQAGLAIKVPQVGDVLSILGATVATAMMMAIPAYAMAKLTPRSAKSQATQAVLWAFALVSVASVPIKVLRWCGALPK